MIILLLLLPPFVIAFVWGIIDGIRLLTHKPPPETVEEETGPKEDERRENYDRQIDGYTQLIKAYDGILEYETDDKKKAAILSKQLITLEKLNKTIEKREKLDS